MDTATSIIIIGMQIFIYILPYRKLKFIGNICFAITWLSILLSTSNETQTAIGIMGFLISIMLLVFDDILLKSKRSSR